MVLRLYALLFFFTFTILLQSCGPRLSSRASEYLSLKDEINECLTEKIYPSYVSVVATASFYKRSTKLISQTTNSVTSLSNMVLGDPLTNPLPIPYAEVAVYDQSKNLIQCGRTDINGQVVGLDGVSSLKIPNKAQNYIIRVYARSRVTTTNKALLASISVKDDIYQNNVHHIETTFSSDGTNLSTINLTAYARQTDDMNITGGAFNIYNNFIQLYEYLDTQIDLPPGDLSCLSNKLNVYWKAGFNPVQYVYPEQDPSTLTDNTSYFDKDTDRLFITGGQLGDVSLSNTDHFDDFPVIHEMGHFVEHHCGKLTKGGTHALIVRIDQRLAWHESWANYTATQVIKNRLQYIDPTMNTRLISLNENYGWTFLNNTYGFSDSYQNISNGQGFMMDFKKPANDPGAWQLPGAYQNIPYDIVNSGVYPGEGHTREGAISRALFKTTNTCSSTCTTLPASYTTIWQSFDANTGLGRAEYKSVNSNLFFELFKANVGTSNWNTYFKTIVEAEALQLFSDHNLAISGTARYVSTVNSIKYLNWVPYGHNLIVNNSCTNKTLIEPRTDEQYFTGLNSDQRYSNHFYTIDTSTLSGLTSLSVKFDFLNGSAVDHDLIIYENDYHFNEDYACSNGATTCSSVNYVTTRLVSKDVVAYNRTPTTTSAVSGATYTKSIQNLDLHLQPNKKYVLDVRAYSAGKSISTATQYAYTINSNLGALCPE